MTVAKRKKPVFLFGKVEVQLLLDIDIREKGTNRPPYSLANECVMGKTKEHNAKGY